MRSRRGLATVVGMVFSIIALTTTVAYVSYSMNILNQYNNAVLVKNQGLTSTNNEKFQIGSVTVKNSKLNITLANTGSLPINFTKIWVQNKSTTDWVKSYTPSAQNRFVAPGATLTNLGQNIPVYINPANSYSVNLVTSRGNAQQFIMNSVSSTPLNIQFVALPPNVPAGFKSQLVMIVNNNSTGTLANVIPQTPVQDVSSTATCTLGTLNPTSSSNTLGPGQTILFSWPLTAGGNPGQTCVYNAQLQGSNQVMQATVTVQVVSLVPATTYAQYSGILTINYTNFRWTQLTTWNTGWSFSSIPNTDFSMTVTNNNNTGNWNFYLSKNSQFMLFPTQSSNGKNTPIPYFIVNSVALSPLAITPYVDNSLGIANQGATATVYFGASTPGGSLQAGPLTPAGTYIGFIALYGKFAPNSGSTGTNYAQTIPFLAVVSN